MIEWSHIRYFERAEFDSPDEPGSGDRMSLLLVQILDEIRHKLDYPLHINSAYRTKRHNTEVSGKIRSAHLTGEAVDIHAPTDKMKYEIVFEAYQHGIKRVGVGHTFIHLDVSETLPRPRMWSY